MDNILFIIAQVIGVVSFVLNILTFSKDTTNKVLLFNGLGNFLGVVQYLLLGAYTGALCCTIAVIRNIIFSRFKKDIPIIYLIIYIVLVLVLNVPLVHHVVDIIPIFNITIFAVALWTKNILYIKYVGIFTCIDGVMYDFLMKAYTAIINELIDGFVGIRSLMRIKSGKIIE